MNKEVRAAIIVMEGTNNEEEAYQSFKHSDASPEIVHLKKLENRTKKLSGYDIVCFPGGFSAGDYVKSRRCHGSENQVKPDERRGRVRGERKASYRILQRISDSG